MIDLSKDILKVKTNNIKKLHEKTKKIKARKDKYQNKYMSIEDVYFDKYIGCYLPKDYNNKELYLAKRLYKCIVMRVYNAKNVSINKKKEVLDEYNWENLKNAIIKTLNLIKKENLSDKNIVCADITRIPFDNLFYKLNIKAKDKEGKVIIKTLDTKVTFATGEVKLGFQKGFTDINGNAVITYHEEALGEPEKCYMTLNFIKNFTPTTGVLDETIAIYYYLGNSNFN